MIKWLKRLFSGQPKPDAVPLCNAKSPYDVTFGVEWCTRMMHDSRTSHESEHLYWRD